MMIEDWEIGALFWNCLYQTDGNEQAALDLVKQKYLGEGSISNGLIRMVRSGYPTGLFCFLCFGRGLCITSGTWINEE